MYTELRWFVKADGTKVLQGYEESTAVWVDVPEVPEAID